MRIPLRLGSLLLAALPTTVPAVDVLMQHNDANRTGANTSETILTRANVNQAQFGRVFKMQVNGHVYAQPLHVSSLDLGAQGVHNVVIIATENNWVYCYDAADPGASGTGRQYWGVNLGTAAANGNGGCGDLTPAVGVTGTPVIDKTAGTIYLISKTLTAGTYANKLHALKLVDGTNRTGSPVTVAGTFPKVGGGAVTFTHKEHFNRPGLLLANSRVYAAFGSHCDADTYQGWVFGWTTSDLAAAPVVYCSSPNGNQGGIWMSGRGLVADPAGNIYCATGNGALNANMPGDKGQALLKLSPTLALQSFFINGNAVAENGSDADFASGGPLLVPGTNRMVMAGKPGNIFVCDTAAGASLGGYTLNANNCLQAITGTDGLNDGWDGNAQAPVYWVSPSGPNVYYWAGRNTNNKPRSYRFNTATNLLNVPAISTGTVNQGGRCGGISLSANGSTAGTGILWSIKSDAGGTSPPGAGRLMALNAEDLTVTLYDSQQNAARDSLGNYTKLSYPTIADGRVYVPTLNASDATNYIAVYGLLGGNPPVKLKITVQPGNALTAATLGTVAVAVVDAADNTVASAVTDVTIALGANPGSATLGGTTTVTTVNGIATFANLTVNNAGTGYTLVATSTIGALTTADIGGPGQVGAQAAQPSGYDVTGGGDDIYGTADKFRFSYLSLSGDFDLRTRVNAIVNTPPGGGNADYTKTGLMARGGTAANSRHAMALVFPSNTPAHNANSGGYEYQYRATDGAGAAAIHPGEAGWTGAAVNVSYPNAWLRLERVGSKFSAYSSTDGTTWNTYITDHTVTFTDPLLVGFAECAHDNSKTATAQFRQVSLKRGTANRILQLDAATSATFTITDAAVTQPPVFTPGAGTFTGPVTVTMTSATAGATIRYTTDGTTPTAASTLYNAGAPPVASATTTFKAIAINGGMSNSAVASAAYTITGSTPYGMPTRGTLPTLTIPAAGATAGTLSGTGLFANTSTQTPSAGMVPYTVNAQLWSDSAHKLRWMAVPNGAQIVFQGSGEFAFPTGTVFVKHFELGTNDTDPMVRKRLETRLLVVTGSNVGYGLTYKWRADNTDADLLDAGGLDEVQTITTATGTRDATWRYPSRSECLTCHLGNAGFVLGPKAAQLNGTFTYASSGVSDNQLRTWNYLRLFTTDIGEAGIPTIPATVAIGTTAASLETRVKSYLEANCAFCHRPGGAATAFTDGRFATSLDNMGLIDVSPNKGSVGITPAADARLVKPGDVAHSVLSVRVHSSDNAIKMPPLARNQVDTEGVAVIDAWIGAGATGGAGTGGAGNESKDKKCGFGSMVSALALAFCALLFRQWLVGRKRDGLPPG